MRKLTTDEVFQIASDYNLNAVRLMSALGVAVPLMLDDETAVTEGAPFSNWAWQHTKSGGEYSLLGDATLQTDKPLSDMAEVYVYQGADHRMWVRPVAEFNERFKRVRPLATPPAAPAATEAPTHCAVDQSPTCANYPACACGKPAATEAPSEHYDEVRATLQGLHALCENISSMERRVGPLGSHARGFTHKITNALRHLDALAAVGASVQPAVIDYDKLKKFAEENRVEYGLLRSAVSYALLK